MMMLQGPGFQLAAAAMQQQNNSTSLPVLNTPQPNLMQKYPARQASTQQQVQCS
jgi:hypothetical protein